MIYEINSYFNNNNNIVTHKETELPQVELEEKKSEPGIVEEMKIEEIVKK